MEGYVEVKESVCICACENHSDISQLVCNRISYGTHKKEIKTLFPNISVVKFATMKKGLAELKSGIYSANVALIRTEKLLKDSGLIKLKSLGANWGHSESNK